MTLLFVSIVVSVVCLGTVSVWLMSRRRRVPADNSAAQPHRSGLAAKDQDKGAAHSPLPVEAGLTVFISVPDREERSRETAAAALAQGSEPEVPEVLDCIHDTLSPVEIGPVKSALQPVGDNVRPSSLPAAIEYQESTANATEILNEELTAAVGHEAVPDEKTATANDQGAHEAISEERQNRSGPKQNEPVVGPDDAEGGETAEDPEEETVLPRYRAPWQRPPQTGSGKARKAKEDKGTWKTLSAVDLGIRLSLTFDRHGFCSISFFPERSEGLDSEVPVKLNGKSYLLLGEDNLYSGFSPENAGRLLRDGIELKAVLLDERDARWRLTGRDLYVLASNKLARGFLSTSRISVGRSHVVLCSTELTDEVEALLHEGGSQSHARLGNDEGVPDGWVGFRDVRPAKALPLEMGSDRFYPIKAAPDIEIDLDGGIYLGGSAWLGGYPPEIKILGEATNVRTLIDGKEAFRSEDGVLTTDDYSSPGSHSVFCEGQSCSRTYSIEAAPESWERWQAHSFARSSICGPLVELSGASNWRSVTVPTSNPILLGTHPGEIFHCSTRGVPLWKGFVPFEVVWALPAQPLRCDKKSARILQLVTAPVAPSGGKRAGALEWSVAILDASRKGLQIEGGSAEAVEIWREYKKTARSIWRAAR